MSDFLMLRNVRKTYGDLVALDSINLTVAEGEFVSFLGPSGCGKTTTLRMIGGFTEPTSGEILFEGRDVAHVPPYKRDFVHTVFQDYALFPHMTVGENVGFGMKYVGLSKSEIEEKAVAALETVGLGNRAQDRPNMLSGGQKQRVALARALALQPKVLLLDEPLSALDAKLREEMQIELKRLHQRIGIAFVFVTHSQREAMVMSDRVVLMNQGRIVQEGSPESLYAAPENLFCADFIGDRSFITTDIIALDATAGTGRAKLNDLEIDIGWVEPGLAVGDAAQVMIDPKSMRITSGNGLPAKVLDHQFLGDSRRVLFETEAGETLNIDIGLDVANLPSVNEVVSLETTNGSIRAFRGAGGS
jgi:putative spermidine/putrescine transport system ATP-binding protein/spermidine/putrescine transport system ATP-binding protein